MTEIALAQLVERRLEQKARICEDLSKHKICGVCTCIIAAEAAVCPVCSSYRWHGNPVLIEALITWLVKRPFPVTKAVAPRCKPPVPKESTKDEG
jgi:hypothetical protein